MKLKAMFTIGMIGTLSQFVSAQEIDVSSVKENVTIFTGILEDALELNQSSGLFGMQLGGVKGSYFVGQGAVLEVRSPLANKRNRAGIGALSLAMQSLPRVNPFETIARTAKETATSASVLSTDAAQEAGVVYQQMMDRIANIDYSLVMSSALQQASEAARSLRNLGSVGPEDYDALQQEIDALREATQQRSAEIRDIVNSLQNSFADANAQNEAESELQQELDRLLSEVEPLKQQALAKAAELKSKSEQAQKDFSAQLDLEIAEFEQSLFNALCAYGATLREVPAQEYVSVILVGLGKDSNEGEKPDKVFVVKKSDLVSCQSGVIDAPALLAAAVSYSY